METDEVQRYRAAFDRLQAEIESLRALVVKLVRSGGLQYRPGSRFNMLDEPPSLRGYDVTLDWSEEDLLRRCLEIPNHYLYEIRDGDEWVHGIATPAQVAASQAAEARGENGLILIDKDGNVVERGSWEAQQLGVREVWTYPG